MRKILAGVAALALSVGLTVSADAANNPPKIGLVLTIIGESRDKPCSSHCSSVTTILKLVQTSR